MPVPEVLVLQDCVDHVAEFMGAAGDEKNARAARWAPIRAYQDLIQYREWKYLWKHYYVALEAAYSTGTVDYDHTGGTYERQLTLASGTWPTNAVYYTVRIDSVDYAVEDRKSGTVLTLDANRNPGADVASGTSYTAFRSTYTLPGDFRAMASPSIANNYNAIYVEPKEWQRLERHNSSTGDPKFWTVLGDDNLVGSMSLAVWPYPSEAKSFAFLYQRAGRKLSYTGYESAAYAGTVSGTEDARNITGSGTSFAGRMVGSIIRFSGDTAKLPDGEGGLNPWLEQKVIVAVTNSTELTVDSDLANTHSNTK